MLRIHLAAAVINNIDKRLLIIYVTILLFFVLIIRVEASMNHSVQRIVAHVFGVV